MTDEQQHPKLTQLREALRRADDAEAKAADATPFRPRLPAPDPEMEKAMEATVHEVAASTRRTMFKRSMARRDALIAVSRAMARREGNVDMTGWSTDDADTVWLIADLLQKRQDKAPMPVDPGFADDDNAPGAA